MKTLIKNAMVITDTGEAPRKQNIEITDDRITGIGIAEDTVGDVVIDASGKLLMPGLINAHTHVAMTVFRGAADDMKLQDWLFKRIFPMEDKLDEHIVYVSSLLGMAEMLRRGTTSIIDMYFFCDSIAAAAEKIGLRTQISRCITGDGHEADMRIREAEELFENYKDSRFVSVRPSAHAIYTCSASTLKKCADMSERYGQGLYIHLAETKKELEDCLNEHGLTPAAYLDSLGCLKQDTLLAHSVYVNDEDIELIALRGSAVAHNPSSNLKLGSGIAPVMNMLSAGIPVALGSDGAASNNMQNIFCEMRLAALLQKGVQFAADTVPANHAIKMATEYGARAMNMKDVGRIGPGMKADLILLDTGLPHMQPLTNAVSNIVYAATGEEVYMTMVDGRIAYQNGSLLGIDTEDLYREANEIAKYICR